MAADDDETPQPTDESAEDIAREIEEDEAREPGDEALKDIKGG